MADRLYALLELAGFAAVAVAAALAGWAAGGPVVSASAGLLVAGGEAIYLANAYALSEPSEVEAPDDKS